MDEHVKKQNILFFSNSAISYFHFDLLKHILQEFKSNKMLNIESLCS